MAHDPVILLLAAGASSRMGGQDKLLLPVNGQPLLRERALQAAATGLPVVAVVPPDRPLRVGALEGTGVRPVIATLAHLGMAASLKAGLADVPAGRAVIILPADMPGITAEELRRVRDAHHLAPDAILRGATQDGRPGHPVLLPPQLTGEIAAIAGDQGARSILARHAALVRLVPLPGDRAIADIDTPADWDRWRATGNRS